jgi:hypothetical protein
MGLLGSLWGLGGILAVIGYAVFRLGQRAARIPSYELTWYHWTGLVLIAVGLVYVKAYRAFYRRLAPWIADRAGQVRRHPNALRVLLAPFYCMGYFDVDVRTQLRMIFITLAMALLIMIVPFIPEPWRAILDLGIAVALGLGFAFILAATLKHIPYSRSSQ